MPRWRRCGCWHSVIPSRHDRHRRARGTRPRHRRGLGGPVAGQRPVPQAVCGGGGLRDGRLAAVHRLAALRPRGFGLSAGHLDGVSRRADPSGRDRHRGRAVDRSLEPRSAARRADRTAGVRRPTAAVGRAGSLWLDLRGRRRAGRVHEPDDPGAAGRRPTPRRPGADLQRQRDRRDGQQRRPADRLPARGSPAAHPRPSRPGDRRCRHVPGQRCTARPAQAGRVTIRPTRAGVDRPDRAAGPRSPRAGTRPAPRPRCWPL